LVTAKVRSERLQGVMSYVTQVEFAEIVRDTPLMASVETSPDDNTRVSDVIFYIVFAAFVIAMTVALVATSTDDLLLTDPIGIARGTMACGRT
jgi:hypothetical protein